VIGASTGLFGAVWAQAEVRKTLAASGAIVLDTEVAVAAADGAFTADASLTDPRLRTCQWSSITSRACAHCSARAASPSAKQLGTGGTSAPASGPRHAGRGCPPSKARL
jgi:NAD(P)H-dependent FMN reductase